MSDKADQIKAGQDYMTKGSAMVQEENFASKVMTACKEFEEAPELNTETTIEDTKIQARPLCISSMDEMMGKLDDPEGEGNTESQCGTASKVNEHSTMGHYRGQTQRHCGICRADKD